MDISAERTVRDLEAVSKRNASESSTDYNSWSLDLLADHIENKHHRYLEAELPVLNRYFEKLSHVHGAQHPELTEIRDILKEMSTELILHLKKEEMILFPFIRSLVKAAEGNGEVLTPPFKTIKAPVEMMKSDHEQEEKRLKRIVELSNNFTVPEDGCSTYRIAYQSLRSFNDDLKLHLFLENSLLFPKAIELEGKLN